MGQSSRLGWLPMGGAFLDPLTEQTPYAPVLLDLFKSILQSPGYAQRLKKHYQLSGRRRLTTSTGAG